MFGKLAGLLMGIVGAFRDPKTGNLAITRASGAVLLTMGADVLNAAASMPEVGAGAVLVAGGVAAIAVRTKAGDAPVAQ